MRVLNSDSEYGLSLPTDGRLRLAMTPSVIIIANIVEPYHWRAVVGVRDELTRFDFLAPTQILQNIACADTVFLGKDLRSDDLAAEKIDD